MFTIKFSKSINIEVEEILKGWHTLSKPLGEALDIHWCIGLLDYEYNNARRPFIIDRIKSRIVNLGAKEVRRQIDDYCFKTYEKRDTRKRNREVFDSSGP